MILPAEINQLMLKTELSSTFTRPTPLRRGVCQCELKDLKPRGVGEESAKEWSLKKSAGEKKEKKKKCG